MTSRYGLFTIIGARYFLIKDNSRLSRSYRCCMDYSKIAAKYEKTRTVESKVYWILSNLLDPNKHEKILDFGCGTGNYLQALYEDFQIIPCGVDLSSEMLRIAKTKNNKFDVREGDHTNIPFEDNTFSKMYCTDVIHQIKNISLLFKNLSRVAKRQCILVICTESVEQLQEKFWNEYFPSILEIDTNRFHSISDIENNAFKFGWKLKQIFSIEEKIVASISKEFVEKTRQRTISVLNLIPDIEYITGLQRILRDYEEKKLIEQKV